MKIVTLIENLVQQTNYVAEHGLSLYIETGGHRLLFDTGLSGKFIDNAVKMGIDLAQVDAVVISHGHYDHAGGLNAFFEINAKAKVYAQKSAFLPKFSRGFKYIGNETNAEVLAKRLIELNEVTEIVPGVYLFPQTKLFDRTDTNFKDFYFQEGDTKRPDEFDDEQFLVLKKNSEINILTACSHRGITNVCATAVEYFKLPVGMILGGFHIKDCPESQYQFMIEYLKRLAPKYIGVSHCTGVDKFARMMNDCSAKVFYNQTGNEINLK
ncbi:MAG TPA: MBL fold metallo-hydrolase [Bacteroidales bacterium]|nr:MBL fold metallo-hydrolase [Bacteroidales bacterium]